MSTDSECFFPLNLLLVSGSCIYTNIPRWIFFGKLGRKLRTGSFFTTLWRCAKKLFIKRLFNCSGVFEKKFLSSKIKIPSRIGSEKRKIGEIWSIINWTLDEEETMNIDQNKKILIGVALGVYLLYKVMGGWAVVKFMILLNRFLSTRFSFPTFPTVLTNSGHYSQWVKNPW